MSLFCASEGGGSSSRVVAINFSEGITAMPWLSSFPWFTPGGLDRASAGMFSLPGVMDEVVVFLEVCVPSGGSSVKVAWRLPVS